MKPTHKCYGCKQDFRTEEMINYASPSAKTKQWYCKKCYNDKLAREKFSNKVCYIFGLKNPGPRIWTERKRLINTYGYTDDIIIECLDYIYNVEKKKKIAESLCLINPAMVEQMRKYRSKQEKVGTQLAQATNQEVYEHIVPMNEEKKKHRGNIIDPDEWLED